MPIKNIIVKKSNHEHDIIWKEVDDVEESEVGEDLRRIRSHVMNEIKEEKYKQLEFDFENDQVAPI
tara:strand:- start:264 stop:461 length:198 start_codon:yes stop_codon:yes gene_type:complete